MVRVTKNTFAPINRLPPEILSCIPDYFEEDPSELTLDDQTILTHVCCSWREIFTSRACFWIA